MKVYLDLVFIINFFYDYLLLLSLGMLLKKKIKVRKILISSLVGTISLIFIFFKLDPFLSFVIKVLISILMIYISYGKDGILYNLFYFYILTIVIGGGEYLICRDVYKTNILFLFILGPIIIYLYIRSIKYLKYEMSIIHDVIIIDGDNVFELKGYLDTGNNLVDPIFNYPVIMVKDNIKFLTNKYFYVPYKVVNDNGIIKCASVDKVIVDGKVINCLLGLCKSDVFKSGVDVILNNNLRRIIC